MQADTTLLDAEYFVPWLLRAFARSTVEQRSAAGGLAADPRVAEAMGRLAQWNDTTPTGIPEGYDASDVNGHLQQPTADEIANSVAATIYAAWRSRAVTGIIDGTLDGLPVPGGAEALTALRHLLDTWSTAHGVGASGIDFFAVPGITQPRVARDYQLLSALSAGLDMLAGPAFDDAFHRIDRSVRLPMGTAAPHRSRSPARRTVQRADGVRTIPVAPAQPERDPGGRWLRHCGRCDPRRPRFEQ